MTDTDIKVTRVHSGPFAWDETELRNHVTQSDMYHVRPYRSKNPRTWPLIRIVKLPNRKDYRKSKLPPPFVAYDAEPMKDLHQCKPLQRFYNSNWPELFHWYPFNFTKGGGLRKSDTIPHKEFVEWIERWGEKGDTTNSTTTSPGSKPQTEELPQMHRGRHTMR
ncbi:hypothetical protein B5807_04315 [Epicoccum nigrum]|uniref:Uncharacterized protein n=1 Tax=Epicoccum nigrum TaxID=105696 RepID=A0A1Y2M6U6_EPING|nr:hypothetical protein B5807_04315 [Epicoccum nigrum]